MAGGTSLQEVYAVGSIPITSTKMFRVPFDSSPPIYNFNKNRL